GEPGRHPRPLPALRPHLRTRRQGPVLRNLRLRPGDDAPPDPGPTGEGRRVPRSREPRDAHSLEADEHTGL
ncbi:MAG: hypothetical protein AVDCRST_MAG01-01-2194, partial [uncultured Rubrobacteraceae bacterium]